jgi:hypothetical protein
MIDERYKPRCRLRKYATAAAAATTTTIKRKAAVVGAREI